MLLASDNPEKVRLHYEKCAALPAFNISSLYRQLKIYQDLGLFEKKVNAALDAVGGDPTAES